MKVVISGSNHPDVSCHSAQENAVVIPITWKKITYSNTYNDAGRMELLETKCVQKLVSIHIKKSFSELFDKNCS